jgi:hypothetical protein
MTSHVSTPLALPVEGGGEKAFGKKDNSVIFKLFETTGVIRQCVDLSKS